MSEFSLVPRATWGFDGPLGPSPIKSPVKEVWLHHSVTGPSGDPYRDMRTLESIGQSRFGRLSYSYGVHPSGVVMEGQGTYVGAHTKGRNSTSVGICWIGNYQVSQPTRAMIRSTALLIRHLVSTGVVAPGVYPTGGHQEAPQAQTACPGSAAMGVLAAIRALVALPPKETDMEAAFVLGLYHAFFNVEPGDRKWDVTGFNYWLKCLLDRADDPAKGLSRNEVRASFAKIAKVG